MTQALEMMLVILRVAKVYQMIEQQKAKSVKTMRDLILMRTTPNFGKKNKQPKSRWGMQLAE